MAEIINPSFEEPGSEPGAAQDWLHEVVSSFVEYATFFKPGLNILVSFIPIGVPLGVHPIAQPDGTIILQSEAGFGTAFEDFAQGWKSNEDFLFAISGSLLRAAFFFGIPSETFENGWKGNEVGLLENFDALATETAVFAGSRLFENFEGGWPGTVPLTFTGNSVYENIVFGVFDVGPNTFVDDDAHVAGQYANYRLIGKVIDTPTSDDAAFNISLTLADGTPFVVAASTDVRGKPVGSVVTVVTSTILGNTGIRDVTAVVKIVGTGKIQLEGEPGLELERAIFS